jgi:hypothetical protein
MRPAAYGDAAAKAMRLLANADVELARLQRTPAAAEDGTIMIDIRKGNHPPARRSSSPEMNTCIGPASACQSAPPHTTLIG